jgi:CopA family copper-resistance protein
MNLSETPEECDSAMTRRAFLGVTAMSLMASYALLGLPGVTSRAMAAVRASLPRAGADILPSLDASDPAGIDLYIDRQPMLINGKVGTAITINGLLPGPVIRMKQGRDVLIRVHNRMDESTSIHWHGVLVPFTMDGVPDLSFPGIPAHTTFTYRYRVRQNGTYWYHSHTGLQEQLGLYGMIIIEPDTPDPITSDIEFPVILSDWTFENPHDIMRNLKTIESYYNFQKPTLANLAQQARNSGQSLRQTLASRLQWQKMRMDPTDISDVTGFTYTYLINGKAAAEPQAFVAQPGQRVRLRLVNASSNTYFDVRLPGLPMTVVQADGQNIQPVETDELRIAVAETYDVMVTLPDEDKAFCLFAEAMDRSGYACASLTPRADRMAHPPARRTRPLLTMADMGMVMSDMNDMEGMKGMDHMDMKMPMDHMKHMHKPEPTPSHSADPAQGLPMENLPDRVIHGPDHHGPQSITMAQTAYRQLDDPGVGLGNDGWRVLTYSQLRCLTTPANRWAPTRQFDLHLTGNMHQFIWGFDGKSYHESEKILFAYGERLRINMINDTMMAHPIHLHGMFMDLYAGGTQQTNPRKHTVNVQPAELVTVDITADAPGLWAFHCHLLYHMEAGMFRTVAVVRSLEEGMSHDA